MRTNSAARSDANTAKVEMTGISPASAMPDATATMFASAIPKSKNRSGIFDSNLPILVEVAKSAVIATIFSFFSASCVRTSP